MLEIRDSLTHQQIGDRFTSKDGTFQNSLIEYLNDCHNGEFLEGVEAEVENCISPLLNKDPKIGRKEVKDPIINVSKSPSDDCKLHKDPEWRTAALSVRTLSNGLVTSNSQWTRFCIASIDMTVAKDGAKIPNILDVRPDSLMRLLRRLL